MKNLLVLLALIFSAFSACSSTEKDANNEDLIILVGECNGVEIDGDEVCDGKDLGTETCESQGFGAGELRCAASCAAFDVTACGASEKCDGDAIDEGEKCDGADLGEETCVSLGYGEGELTCERNCSGFDIRNCGAAETCGNGQLDEGEVCDGLDFGGVSCESLELGEGAISCFENCLGLDTSICDVPLVCEPECPGELTCERGVCVGPLDDLILNEVGFNVSGKIQVEGQTPAIGIYCADNPTREIANISFVENTLGYRADIPIRCQDNFRFQTRLPVGTYEVRVRRGTYGERAEVNLFPVDYLVRPSLTVDQDLSNEVLNEVGFDVSGRVQVEGQTPTIGTYCADNPTREIAIVSFVEKTLGYRADLPIRCQDNFRFQTRLPIGTYEVRVRRGTYGERAEVNLFPVDYFARSALKVDKDLSNEVLNEVGFDVSGRVQVEGQTPTIGIYCADNPTREIAIVSFVEKTLGYRADLPIRCQDNFRFQTRLPVGTYEVRVRRGTYGERAEVNLFPVDYLARPSLKVDKNLTNKMLNEVGFDVSGRVQVEGQTPTIGIYCADNPTREIANVSFVEKNLGYRADLPVRCQDNFRFQTRLPIGTYEVRVRRGTYGERAEVNLFPVDYLANKSLKVDKDLPNEVLNEVGFDVSGRVQVEGQAPTIGIYCADNPTREIANISFIEKNLGYRADLPIRCQDNFRFQTRLPVGTYEVRVRLGTYGERAEVNLFPVDYLARASLKVDKDLSNELLNEVGFDVAGRIQVEGQTPTIGIYCADNPTREIANVSFVEQTLGYHADLPIRCQDNFRFQTRLAVGTYEVRVRRGTYAERAEVNLFPIDYLAIHRLAVE